jgi:mono/diheme cytochrome c family protein
MAAAASVVVMAQPAGAGARGQLLYETHCVACHDRQMHWREQRLATDWTSLLAQVRAWQGREQLGWNDEDIAAVAGYLNDTIYRHPRGAARQLARLDAR